jgi:hypothetical protein
MLRWKRNDNDCENKNKFTGKMEECKRRVNGMEIGKQKTFEGALLVKINPSRWPDFYFRL